MADLLAVAVVIAVAGGFIALLVVARLRVGRGDHRVSSAAADIDGLFTASRRHAVEYHHAQQMRRDDVGDRSDG